MNDENGVLDLESDRRWWRVLLTVACVAAVVLASVALPLFAGDTAPAARFNLGQPLSGEGSLGGGADGLGALSATDRTRVGSPEGSEGSNPYSSLNREVHFVVESDRPSYWRTGSFDAYTGQGWRRTGESEPFDGTTAVEGAAGEQVRYQVTLARSATAMPTVWRPSSLSLGGGPFRLAPGRSVFSEEPISAGTTYAGESVAPPSEPSLLRTAGDDYPTDVESTYTTLPPGSDTERVGAFTDELTADADSAYETATRIEGWLESNKGYSLNASHDREQGTIASEFVFEMSEGYCEYFASAMTVMLRSQDVPARYVVGYATGEQTGENEYTVRGMHAHAWVEVYFPDVGWVRFDPTPSGERQAAEEEALDETSTPTPTPEPTPTPTDSVPTAADEPLADDPLTLDVSLNRSAVPGATVAVTVTRNSDPVRDALVLFNGEPIGRTDAGGIAVGEVPYSEELNVTVQTESAGALPPPGEAVHAVDGYALQTGENRTFPLDTNASVSFAGEIRSGADVTLVATVGDVPIRDAAVSRNGERIGRTDDRGRLAISLPSEPGEYRYSVSRGSVSGERSVSIRTLELNHSVGWPVTVPFAPVTVNATLGGEPVANATVFVGGETAGVTGVDGTATRRLPPSNSVNLAVAAYGQRVETDVDGLLTTLGAIVAGLLVGAVALFGGAHRIGVTPRGVLARIPRAVLRGYQLVLIGVVSLSDALSRGVHAVATALRSVGRRLLELAHALRNRTKTPGEVARIIVDAVLVWAASTAVALRELPETVLAWIRETREEAAAWDATEAVDDDSVPDDPETAAARERVREAWQRFLAMLPLRRVRTLTPGEVARIAVEDAKLPAEPVERLRDAYREVSYGGADPESRQTVAEEAIDALDGDAASESDDADGAGGDAA